jgi:hypothetical protein
MPLLTEIHADSGKTYHTPGLAFGTQPGRIQRSDLEPGDVLVWYATGGSDKDLLTHTTIRNSTEGAFSHVGVYVGAGESVDAGPDGVTKEDVAELIQHFELGRVLRYRGLDPQRQDIIVNKANSFVGAAYATLDAIGMPLRRLAFRRIEQNQKCKTPQERIGKMLIFIRRFIKSPLRKTFCSQLVLEAYGAAGIYSKEQVKSAALSPNDFIERIDFGYVGFLSKKTAPDEHPFDLLSSSPHPSTGFWQPGTPA